MINRDHDYTLRVAGTAIDRIKALSLPADPQGFELWYRYATGHDPELNGAINRALETTGRLSIREAEEIYHQYLASSRPETKINDAGSRLSIEVDKIVELEEEKRIVGLKNVTINEQFFQGHFPGAPVMPGVLVIEAMAQVAGVLIYRNMPDKHTKLIYFTGIENAKFRRPVVPGDQLRIEMELLNRRTNFGKMNGRASVDGKLVAEAVVVFAVVDRPGK